MNAFENIVCCLYDQFGWQNVRKAKDYSIHERTRAQTHTIWHRNRGHYNRPIGRNVLHVREEKKLRMLTNILLSK